MEELQRMRRYGFWGGGVGLKVWWCLGLRGEGWKSCCAREGTVLGLVCRIEGVVSRVEGWGLEELRRVRSRYACRASPVTERLLLRF